MKRMLRRLPMLFSLVVAALALPSRPAAAQPRCEAPRVIFTVDKSSSMLGGLPDGNTKWDAASMALAEAANGFEGRVDFGLQVFPFPNRCEPGAVTIDVGEHSATDLVGALGTPPPTGGNYTPMAQTLDVLAGYAPILEPGVDAHVVLITDGWQYCDPYDASTRFTPVNSVTRLRDLGLTVHVIGFGGGVDSLTLNRASVAGGTALPGCDPTLSEPSAANHCYHQADNLAELRTALDEVARTITSEECDGLDNDCDGNIDEGFDTDADGYTTCGSDPVTGGGPDMDRVDCDDSNDEVSPGATEVCNGIDDDCDGSIDPGCECTPGEERGCGVSVGACMEGTQRCDGGVWSECTGAVEPAAVDSCDGTDEDCDGFTDEAADCGPGSVCVDGACEDTTPVVPPVEPEPEPEPEPNIIGGAAGGAGCAAGGSSSGFGALLLGLVGLVLRRRRR